MPMVALSPTVQPWTMAPWPTVTYSPRVVGNLSEWRMAPSWMLQPAPTVMGCPSPRRTALNHTEQPGPKDTFPTTAAPGRMTTFSSL